MCVRTSQIPDGWKTPMLLWFSRKTRGDQALVIEHFFHYFDEFDKPALCFYLNRKLLSDETVCFWNEYQQLVGNGNKDMRLTQFGSFLEAIARIQVSVLFF